MRANGSVLWNLHLRWEVNNWEILAVASLMRKLERAEMEDEDTKDHRLWQPSPSDGFFVSSFDSIIGPVGDVERPTREVWRFKIPSKFCFLLWLIHFNRVLTLENLKKRGM